MALPVVGWPELRGQVKVSGRTLPSNEHQLHCTPYILSLHLKTLLIREVPYSMGHILLHSHS